jgi:hypothetical protein
MTDNTAPKDEYDYPVAHMTFDPVPFNFDSLPSNEQAARDAVSAMPVFRMAAVIACYGDKDLEQIVRQEPEANLGFLECIVSHIQATKSRLGILEQAFCRLSVVLERYANDEESKASC